MEMSTSARRKLVDQGQRSHVEDLLRRYPDIAVGEAAEILRFLKKGPPLEVALITANEQLKSNLRQFRADRAADFSLGLKEYLIVILVIASIIGACILLWDAGVR